MSGVAPLSRTATGAAFQVRYPNHVARLDPLAHAVSAAPRVRWEGQGVRDMPAHRLKRKADGGSPDLLFAGGSEFTHNRYVPKGPTKALHISDGITTAAAEVAGVTPTPKPVIGLPKESRLALLVHFDVRDLLDLTASSVRDQLNVTEEELTVERNLLRVDASGRPDAYELTQCIGELAYDMGCGGIKYPAARNTSGVNLVVFTERLEANGGSIWAADPVSGDVIRLP